MKEDRPIHPVLFTIFPILFLFIHNLKTNYLHFHELIGLVSFFLIISFTFLIILNLFLKNMQKSSLITSIIISFVIFFPFWVHISSNIIKFRFIPSHLVVILFLLSIFISLISIIRSSIPLSGITSFLNYFGLFLIGISVLSGAYAYLIQKDAESIILSKKIKNTPKDLYSPSNPPSIVHIVLDAYGGSDVLKEIYSYDNHDFISFLKGKGFFVGEKSQCNYCLTFPSLASTLNYTYLNNLSKKMGEESSDNRPLIRLIWHSKIRRFLKELGYKFIVLSSGYFSTEVSDADILVNEFQVNFFFAKLVLRSSILNSFLGRTVDDFQRDNHRQRILANFDKILAIAKKNSPSFIFLHIMSPHPPFVFSKTQLGRDSLFSIYDDGSHLHRMKKDLQKEYIQGYRDQVAFLNQRLQALVNELLSQLSQPPIIIIQGDHGPRYGTDWNSSENTNLKERFSILNALYLPGNKIKFHIDITPVNTFRIILKEYFSCNLSLLEDKIFFSTPQKPYKFSILDRKNFRTLP